MEGCGTRILMVSEGTSTPSSMSRGSARQRRRPRHDDRRAAQGVPRDGKPLEHVDGFAPQPEIPEIPNHLDMRAPHAVDGRERKRWRRQGRLVLRHPRLRATG